MAVSIRIKKEGHGMAISMTGVAQFGTVLLCALSQDICCGLARKGWCCYLAPPKPLTQHPSIYSSCNSQIIQLLISLNNPFFLQLDCMIFDTDENRTLVLFSVHALAKLSHIKRDPLTRLDLYRSSMVKLALIWTSAI